MAKALLLAWSSPVDAAGEAEFHEWYSNTHIPQIGTAIPEVTNTTRYRLVTPGKSPDETAARYLAVYEIDSDNVAESAGKLGAALAGGALDMSASMDTATNPPELQWLQQV